MALESIDFIKKYEVEYGFSLIPNYPKTKKPAFKEGGYKKYFDKVCSKPIPPDYNVGVMLGKPSNNLVAFDDDTGKETFLELFPQYRNKTFATKSGMKGGAVFFRLMELPTFSYATIKKDGKQIEFFSRKKQIILPPSIHPDTGKQYEITSDCTVLDLSQSEFDQIFEKFKEEGWEISNNTNSHFPLGIASKNTIVHQGENRSLFLLIQIDSWKVKNPELDEAMLYGMASRWNQLHCDPPYPESKIKSLVKQGYEFGSKILQEPNEAVDENERLEREKEATSLQQIEKYLNTQIKKDPKLTSQLLRICLSTYTDNPINVGLLAPSSDGKTYATIQTTEIFPKEDVIVLGKVSPTALIHQHGELVDRDGNPIRQKLDDLENQIKNARKEEKDDLKKQIQALLNGAKNCIDFKDRIVLFLDNPAPATYEMIKPIMSHDKKEIIYKTTKADGSLTVKETIIKNWPVFIFCSAKNEAHNDVWQEIQNRVLLISPNSSVQKYKEANKFTAQKMGLPSWSSGVYHNTEDEKWSKWYVRNFKKSLNELSCNGNPVLNPFYSILSDVFPSTQGDYMRHFHRLCSFINLETMLNADQRPTYALESDGHLRTAVIATIDDIDLACKTMGEIGNSLPPEKIKFYNEIFCPLFDRKSKEPSSTVGETWLTSAELAEEYTKKWKKTTDSKKILENYLYPLAEVGIIDYTQNPSMKQQNRYCRAGKLSTHNIMDLKSKIVEDSKTVDSCVVSCLDSIVESSTINGKYNEKIKLNNKTITREQLVGFISGKKIED